MVVVCSLLLSRCRRAGPLSAASVWGCGRSLRLTTAACEALCVVSRTLEKQGLAQGTRSPAGLPEAHPFFPFPPESFRRLLCGSRSRHPPAFAHCIPRCKASGYKIRRRMFLAHRTKRPPTAWARIYFGLLRGKSTNSHGPDRQIAASSAACCFYMPACCYVMQSFGVPLLALLA